MHALVCGHVVEEEIDDIVDLTAEEVEGNTRNHLKMVIFWALQFLFVTIA